MVLVIEWQRRELGIDKGTSARDVLPRSLSEAATYGSVRSPIGLCVHRVNSARKSALWPLDTSLAKLVATVSTLKRGALAGELVRPEVTARACPAACAGA